MLLNLEFMPIKGEAEYFSGETRNFSRDGLCFSSDNFKSEPLESIMVKFKHLRDYMYIYALGDIVWKKQSADKCRVGIKIRNIDQESRSRKLDFPFSWWLENIQDRI